MLLLLLKVPAAFALVALTIGARAQPLPHTSALRGMSVLSGRLRRLLISSPTLGTGAVWLLLWFAVLRHLKIFKKQQSADTH